MPLAFLSSILIGRETPSKVIIPIPIPIPPRPDSFVERYHLLNSPLFGCAGSIRIQDLLPEQRNSRRIMSSGDMRVEGYSPKDLDSVLVSSGFDVPESITTVNAR